MCVSTWGSQGGMQNKSGIFVAFISKSQKPRDRLLFKEINLEKLSQVLVHVTRTCEQERPWKHYLYSKTQKPRKHPWTGGHKQVRVYSHQTRVEM